MGGAPGSGSASTKQRLPCLTGPCPVRLVPPGTALQYLWMRVEYLNETLSREWHRMVAAEAQRHADEGEAGGAAAAVLEEDATQLFQAEAERSHGSSNGYGDRCGSCSSSNGSSSGAGHSPEQQQQQQDVAAVANGSSGAACGVPAVYAPGAPLAGTASGGPGSIPWAAEQHVHEVTTTGAAISLALLLQQRSEQGEPRGGQPGGAAAGSGVADAARSARLSLVEGEARASSTAALSALAYLEPCAHGLDELIVFDAIRRKFGIAPRVEGRILRCPSC